TLGTYPAGLTPIQGEVVLYDTGGSDQLVVNGRDVRLAAGNLISPNGKEDPYTSAGGLISPGGQEAPSTNLESPFFRAPGGSSSVTVESLAENVHATVFGAARVNIGGGLLTNVVGAVDVFNDSGRFFYSDGYRGNSTTALTVDDSLNPTPTSYT